MLTMFNVRDFGAVGNGEQYDTEAIQSAIDKCSESGGGTVFFPNGKYMTGTIYMKNNVTIYLEVSAVLLGSQYIEDYPLDTHYQRYYGEAHMDGCLIYSKDVENISFTGPGTIDGQGHLFTRGSSPRPMLMRFLNCRNIRLTGLRMRRSAAWCTAFILCDTVYADSLDIISQANENGDGLDFDSCCNVLVSNCKFDTSDDSICLQNSEKDHPGRNITITNCIMSSKYAAIRIGLLSSGDLEDVAVSNCIFHDISCSGFKIQSTEGGHIRNMIFQNIVMRNVPRPVFLTFNHFHMGKDAPAVPPETGGISGLRFDNISIENDGDKGFDPASGVVMTGTPGFYIKDICISNLSFTTTGGGKKELGRIRDIPELTDQRPEYSAFNQVPSYGIYGRHIKGLTVTNVKLDFRKLDERPPIVLDDAENVQLSAVKASVTEETESLIKLYDTRQAHIHDCRPLNEIHDFVCVEGLQSSQK